MARGDRPLMIVVASLAIVAGCIEDGSSQGSDSTVSPAPDQASLGGRVMDDSAVPLAEALVGLLGPGVNLNTTTDATGAFLFAAITPGSYELVASKPGYTSATVRATVGAGEARSDMDLALVPLPAPLETYHETLPFEGFIACHANIGFWTLVVNQVCETDPNHKPLFPFEVFRDRGLVAVVLELDWEPTTAVTGAQIRQELWKNPSCGSTSCDPDRRYGYAQGGPPLKSVYGSAAEPFVDDVAATGPTELASFVLAPNTADYTGTGFVFQQAVTHYASIFYNGEPASDYSAVGPT